MVTLFGKENCFANVVKFPNLSELACTFRFRPNLEHMSIRFMNFVVIIYFTSRGKENSLYNTISYIMCVRV